MKTKGPILFVLLLVSPLLAESLPQEAQDALLKGNWSGVLGVLEKTELEEADASCRMVAAHACLATNRNNASLLMFLSVKEQKDTKLWSQWSKSLLQNHPQNPIALYLSADAEARQGREKEAIEGFTKALEVKKDFALALNARGVVRVLNNEWDEASMDFLNAIQCDQKLADAHANMGTYWVVRESAQGAIKSFDKAIAINPEFALAYNGMGCAYFGKGDFEKAAHNFSIACQLSPVLVMAEINQGYASTYAAQLVTLTSVEKKPGTTLKSIMQQNSDTQKEQQAQLLKMLPSKDDRNFWNTVDSLPTLSNDHLKSFVQEYGTQKVQIASTLKRQELEGQISKTYPTKGLPLSDKINFFNDASSFSFYSTGMDKNIRNIWKKSSRTGPTELSKANQMSPPPAGHIIFCAPGKGPSDAFSATGHIALSLGGGKIYEMPGQNESGTRASAPRLTTWDKLTNNYSSVHSVPIPGATTSDIDRIVKRADEVVKNPTGYYSEQYDVLTHNCIQSVKHIARDVGLDLGDPDWKTSELPWQFYTWTRNKNTPVRRLPQETSIFQEQFTAASQLRNVETKLNTISDVSPITTSRQSTSRIPGYYTSVDRPLTEVGAIASMVDKSISKPPDGSMRHALVVAQDPFRATIQQQELQRYGFATKLISSNTDIQAEAKNYSADVIVGIKGTSQIELSKIGRIPIEDTSKYYWDDIRRKLPPPFPPDKFGGAGVGSSQSIQPQIKQNWDWGKPFNPSYPKGSPGGISTEELASSFVDKGNWPVLTSFGLLYQTNTSPDGEN